MISEFSVEAWAAIAVLSLALNYSVVKAQVALQREEIRAAVDVEKGRWLAETLDVFAEAEALALAGAGPAQEARRLLLAQRLSTLADQGRLSFPNLDPKNKGAENPAAYQGFRQPALDAVILAHDLMRELPDLPAGGGQKVQQLLFACRRILVSEVQKSVDPRRRSQVLSAQRVRSRKEREASYADVNKVVREMESLEMTKISIS